jgi:hypothetical protein
MICAAKCPDTGGAQKRQYAAMLSRLHNIFTDGNLCRVLKNLNRAVRAVAVGVSAELFFFNDHRLYQYFAERPWLSFFRVSHSAHR